MPKKKRVSARTHRVVIDDDDAPFDENVWVSHLNLASPTHISPIFLTGRLGGVKTKIVSQVFNSMVVWQQQYEEDQRHSDLLFPTLADIVSPRTDDVQHLQAENRQLLLECERYKTLLLTARREQLDARQTAEKTDQEMDRLYRQNNGQLDCILNLTRANAELQQALINRTDGRLSMHEHNSGVVVDCVDDHVAVRYETSEGPIEQIYHVNQFARGQVPKTGDRIEAHVFAWRWEHEPKGIEHYLTPEEIENAREAFEKGATGPVES